MNVSLNTSRDKGTGRDTVVTRTRVRSSRRTSLGDWVIEDGRADRLYTSAGYCDVAGDSVSFHYWVKDYLGSVRAICDSRGCLEQATDYLACGVPVECGLPPSISTAGASEVAGGQRAPAMAGAGDGTAAVQPELLTVDVDPHKHCGKELELFSGLGWYYNQARLYDPVLMRFTTLDPLAEKYYPTSPYAYCQNDPMSYIDLNGKEKILLDNRPNTDEDKKKELEILENYKDDGAINVWMHGSSDGTKAIIYESSGEPGKTEISDPSKLKDLIVSKMPKIGKNSLNLLLGGRVRIVLHSCNLGKPGGMAQKLSGEMPNATIIAPDDVLKETLSGKISTDNTGKWIFFTNGRKVCSVPETYSPNQKFFDFKKDMLIHKNQTKN